MIFEVPMKRFLFIILIFNVLCVNAQTEKKSIRKGNNAYEKEDYVESEVQYRKALETNAHSIKGNYNLANSLYKQEKFEDAVTTSSEINMAGLSDLQKAAVYHNKGNAFFKQQKFQESADAYKQALKLNPKDTETKYNMSEALRMLKQQQQQQQQNKDNQNQDNKNDENKDQNQQDQQQNKDENKDQNDDQKKDNHDQNKQDQQQNQDKQQQQQQPQQISKEDAERMLEAIQNNEKDVQDKMKEQKAKAAKVKVLKNW